MQRMTPELLLPPHDRMTCTACFPQRANWGETRILSEDGWSLENNPCAWGARSPRFLVLGFSKGERQSRNILAKDHDAIPFDGFRPRLAAGLRMLTLLEEGDTVDNHIRVDEPDWAFGSVVRCSLAKDGKKSGTVISSSATARSYEEWRDRCTDLYLSRLPVRLQIVIMLSNDDTYVENCRARITRLHPGTRKINEVAYGDGRVTWVHIVHFGGQGFNHMRDWTELADNTAGRKGQAARDAVIGALGSCA